MFKSIFQISILILLLFSNDVHGWCSPSDSGDCELKIRNGKKSTDANQRTVRFLNSKVIKIKKKICVWFFTTSDKIINFLGKKFKNTEGAYGTVPVWN